MRHGWTSQPANEIQVKIPKCAYDTEKKRWKNEGKIAGGHQPTWARSSDWDLLASVFIVGRCWEGSSTLANRRPWAVWRDVPVLID